MGKKNTENTACLSARVKSPPLQELDPARRPFQWDTKKHIAAERLATGCETKKGIAKSLNISRDTLYIWQCHPEFAGEVKRLVLETGLALRENQMSALKHNAELLGAELTRRLEGKGISKISTTQLLKLHSGLLRHISYLMALPHPEQNYASGRVTVKITDQLPNMSDAEIMACMREQDKILQLINKPEGCYVPSESDDTEDEEK